MLHFVDSEFTYSYPAPIATTPSSSSGRPCSFSSGRSRRRTKRGSRNRRRPARSRRDAPPRGLRSSACARAGRSRRIPRYERELFSLRSKTIFVVGLKGFGYIEARRVTSGIPARSSSTAVILSGARVSVSNASIPAKVTLLPVVSGTETSLVHALPILE